MKKRLFNVLLYLCALSLLLAETALALDGKATILSLNDIHGHIYPEKDAGGLAKAATAIKTFRNSIPGNVFVVEVGDVNEGPLFFYYRGKAEMCGLNALGTDVGTFGNHEFDLGKDGFFELAGYADFPLTVANLRYKDGSALPFSEYIVKTTAEGMKIAFFGLITPSLSNVTKGSGDFAAGQDLIGEAERMVTILARDDRPDAIVLLSHCGLEADRMIAENVAGIHAIVGGHSHTLMRDGEFVEGPGGWVTLVGQAGSYARHLGVMELEVKDGLLDRGGSSWGVLELTPDVPADEEVAALIEPFREELAGRLSEPLAPQPEDMDARNETVRGREAPLGNFIADGFRWKSGADAAIINGGAIRGNTIYPAGTASYATVTNIMPFGNTLYMGTVSGRELLEVMETSASALIGPGDEYDGAVRTPTGGFMQISGLRVVMDSAKPPLLIDNNAVVRRAGERVVKLEILQKDNTWALVDPEKRYTLAATDWTSGGGDKYALLKKNGSFVPLNQAIMETTAEYIRHLGALKGEVDGRITILP